MEGSEWETCLQEGEAKGRRAYVICGCDAVCVISVVWRGECCLSCTALNKPAGLYILMCVGARRRDDAKQRARGERNTFGENGGRHTHTHTHTHTRCMGRRMDREGSGGWQEGGSQPAPHAARAIVGCFGEPKGGGVRWRTEGGRTKQRRRRRQKTHKHTSWGQKEKPPVWVPLGNAPARNPARITRETKGGAAGGSGGANKAGAHEKEGAGVNGGGLMCGGHRVRDGLSVEVRTSSVKKKPRPGAEESTRPNQSEGAARGAPRAACSQGGVAGPT